MTLAALYQLARRTPHNINFFVPLLYDLARQCQYVTEFGTEHGVSTTAFLFAQPESLTCYDIRQKLPEIKRLEALTGRTRFRFVEADDRIVHIESTDLLFIDTDHTYQQLKEELRLHADKASRWIILHDTTAYPEMWSAVDEFLELGTFCIQQQFTQSNGLTVLTRK